MALPKIATPKYTLVMPSTGDVIEYRPYTVKEEKALVLALESKDQGMMVRAIRDLISECTYSKVDAYKLAMFDFEYIFLKLRSKSVGEISTIMVSCKNCSTDNEVDVNLEDIQVSGKVEKNMKIMLSENVGVTLSYPKVKQFVEELGVSGEKQSEYETTVGLVASSIDTIFDEEQVYVREDHSPKEWKEFLESLSTQQFAMIAEKFENIPAVKHEIEFRCVSCGTHNNVLLEGLQSFF